MAKNVLFVVQYHKNCKVNIVSSNQAPVDSSVIFGMISFSSKGLMKVRVY